MKNILSVLLLGTVLLQGTYSWGATSSSALKGEGDTHSSSLSSVRPVTAPAMATASLDDLPKQEHYSTWTSWALGKGETVVPLAGVAEILQQSARDSSLMRQQVAQLTVAAERKEILETALGASQTETARLREENARLQEALRQMNLQSGANLELAQHASERLRTLTTEKDEVRRIASLQAERAEHLEKIKEEQNQIIESLRKVEEEYNKLKAEREALDLRLSRTLQTEVGTADVKEGLEKLIREKRAKEQELSEQTERLQKKKSENESLIRDIQQAQLQSDPYWHLHDLITAPVREVSDEQLAEEIFAMMAIHKIPDLKSVRASMSVHPVSRKEASKSLVQLLIEFSRPTDEAYGRQTIIRGSDGDKYRNRDRLLGNQLLENGLGWGGPVDYDRIVFGSSKMGTNFQNARRALLRS